MTVSKRSNSSFNKMFAPTLGILLFLGIQLKDPGPRYRKVCLVYCTLVKMIVMGAFLTSYVLIFRYLSLGGFKYAKFTHSSGIIANLSKATMLYVTFVLRRSRMANLHQQLQECFVDMEKTNKKKWVRICISTQIVLMLVLAINFFMGLTNLTKIMTNDRRFVVYATYAEDCFIKMTLNVTTYAYPIPVYYYVLITYVIWHMLLHFQAVATKQRRNIEHVTLVTTGDFGNYHWYIKPGFSSSYKLKLMERHQKLCRLIETTEVLFREAIVLSTLSEFMHLIFLIRSIDYNVIDFRARYNLIFIFSSIFFSLFTKILSGSLINEQVSDALVV